MGRGKTFRVFISHSWRYGEHYSRLLRLLNDCDPNVRFLDYSVPEDDPIHDAGTVRDLCEAIKRQMTPSQVVLILGGVYSTYSRWINKEIVLAKCKFERPKPVLLIRPRGSAKLSCPVQCAADDVVGWDCRAIIERIRRLIESETLKDCEDVRECMGKKCNMRMEICPI
ncbi:MAG: molecular chaperone Tir [Thermotogae bacterium]|nr:molecular chaperone Tir [Thermotogota bacterium]